MASSMASVTPSAAASAPGKGLRARPLETMLGKASASLTALQYAAEQGQPAERPIGTSRIAKSIPRWYWPILRSTRWSNEGARVHRADWWIGHCKGVWE
jgi:hypothetical protein